jgi:NAD(P)-dependent dehydrogenase (short-subunit alcohol dehydrogenase family)
MSVSAAWVSRNQLVSTDDARTINRVEELLMRLEGKVAVITGGGRGIGEAIARRFAREGAAIVVADRDAASCQAVAESLREEFGARTTWFQVNVGYEEQVDALFAAVRREMGHVDLLVNNAQGFNGVAPLVEKTTGEFDYSLRTGFYATFWAMRAALPLMRGGGGGSIINLVSLDGVTGKVMVGDYDVAKEAIRGLSKVAAREWGPYQVRVNCIAPSAATPVLENSTRQWPGFTDAIVKATPLGRVGDPETDIAGVALFLASEDSQYLTGMTLFADGGMFLAPPKLPVVTGEGLPRPERRIQWVSR